MSERFTVRKIRAKELGATLRRRLHLVPEEQVSITVVRKSGRKPRRASDPWIEVRGTLTSEEADEMISAIRESRRSNTNLPDIDAA